MLRFTNLLRLSIILTTALVFSACLQTEWNDPNQSQAMQATQAETEAGSNFSPTSGPPATGIPTLTYNEPARLELGQPFWIGRGKIIEADFLPSAERVVIAWGSGVSLNTVETGREIWFQPTLENLIAFDVHPQGQAFAAALTDGSVVMFDAADGTSRRVTGARPNAYWGDIAWSPDGKTLAFQFIGPNRSDPIYLLDVASGQIGEVPQSQTGEGNVPALIWSPDGSSITIAALGDACPRFVDIRTGEERMQIGQPGQCYTIPPLLFLRDGKTLAVQGQAGGVDLLRFPDGSRIRTLESTSSGIIGRLVDFPAASESLIMDPGGQWIAARGGYEPCYCDSGANQSEHPLIVWDLASGLVRAQLNQVQDSLAMRHRLAAAFDGESILMLYESGEITRWTFSGLHANETIVARVPSRPVSAQTLSWAADGSHLAFTGSYGGVDVYETATWQLVQRFDPPLNSPALSPDGRLAALFDPEKNVETVYGMQDGGPLQTLSASPVLMSPAFSPDGQFLAYANGARAVVAELASGKVTVLGSTTLESLTPDMAVTRLMWSPDGKALVTVFGAGSPGSGGPGVIVLWKRLGDGSFEAVHHTANVQANYTLANLVLATFNPSGSRVALQSMSEPEASQTELVVYDIQTGKAIQRLQEYYPAVWINDDELLTAEAQYDTRLVRVNLNSGEKTVGAGRDLRDNAYAPNGNFFAHMSYPPVRGVTIRHWRSGEILAQGQHESLNVLDYCWSPDGRWLASTGDDGTLRLWRVTYEK